MFWLKGIIDLFCFKGRKLYCSVVDYHNAFDTIWSLWFKLLKYGINGKLFDVIKNMYKHIKSCVVVNGTKSEYFMSFKGVRQGVWEEKF